MGSLVASIFNDVIGPVMRGPSSSHSAASVRIGRLLFDLLGGSPDRVEVRFDKMGSLATTHESQGTDMGLFAGLMGWEADDPRLASSPEVLRNAGAQITIELSDQHDAHPNTYRIEVWRAQRHHSMVALSTGGGIIEVIEIDGRPLQLFGDYHTTLMYTDGTAELEDTTDWPDTVQLLQDHDDLIVALSPAALELSQLVAAPGVSDVRCLRPVLPVLSRPDVTVPFSHASEIPQADLDGGVGLDAMALAYEQARGAMTADDVMRQAAAILATMRQSVETGLSGTSYDDRILGNQSGRFGELSRSGRLLDGGLLNRMIEYVTALMEAKSAMEVIVAAPTAGACATFPGALLAAVDEMSVSDDDACRALLAGGLIGVFITNKSSFAAEVGGCQAETGAGAAMAAAALVTLAGGDARQALSAASQSLQNVLGLICDPVANRVEAPCLGRNVSGAANALSCANMALAGYDHLIPFDEVLDAHRQVSEMMARELRCTGLGGLATTPTAQRIELDLARHRSGS